jgi:hypothetical protein
MQALKLLKFMKGVTRLRTPWNPTENGYYSWLLCLNEGGSVFNVVVGIFKKEDRWIFGKGYIYVYCFGKRWYKELDKKNTS